MQSEPPKLTDTQARARYLARAQRADPPALFLHEDAAAEVHERLDEVNRTFTRPAVVTPYPQVWSGWAGAHCVPEGDVLDLEAGAHDLVVHALSLHWANDPVGQLIQCRRALRPDGLMIALTFGGRTLHELRGAMAEAEVAATGGMSPRVAPMGEIRDLGGLLQRAGFALPVADAWTRTVTYATPFDLMRDLRRMGEGNALSARHRRTPPRALFSEAARRYAQAFATPDGRIPATFEIVALTGWAPDTSQPQPLRPGSATTRLADALGTAERPAGETTRTPKD